MKFEISNTSPFSVSNNLPEILDTFSLKIIFIAMFEYPSPQAYTLPLSSSAKLIFLYATICFILLNSLIFIGVLTSFLSPFPSCPFSPAPHAYTSPCFSKC